MVELLALIKESILEEKVLLCGFDNNPYKYMAKREFLVFALCLAVSFKHRKFGLSQQVCTDHKVVQESF